MKNLEHKCEEFKKCLKSHYVYGWGMAFNSIFYDASLGYWLVGNDEYYTRVNYCPCCGTKLEVPQSDFKENGAHPIGKT